MSLHSMDLFICCRDFHLFSSLAAEKCFSVQHQWQGRLKRKVRKKEAKLLLSDSSSFSSLLSHHVLVFIIIIWIIRTMLAHCFDETILIELKICHLLFSGHYGPVSGRVVNVPSPPRVSSLDAGTDVISCGCHTASQWPSLPPHHQRHHWAL